MSVEDLNHRDTEGTEKEEGKKCFTRPNSMWNHRSVMSHNLSDTNEAFTPDPENEHALSGLVIGAAIEVHRELGPGLLESAYEESLCHEVTLRRIRFTRQVPQPVTYKGVHLDSGYRLDILVDGRLIVEIKAVEELHPIHTAQLLTYLKLSKVRVGLLLKFHTVVLKDAIKRFVHSLNGKPLLLLSAPSVSPWLN